MTRTHGPGVRAELEEYLTRLWQRGVLSGSSPEEAFFVRCDANTMTADDIAQGRIVAVTGLAFSDDQLRILGPVELRAQSPA